MIIDTHCHVYPKLSDFIKEGLESFPLPVEADIINRPISFIEENIQKLKPKYRHYANEYLSLVHRLQTESRNLPENFLPLTDASIGLLGAGNTLFDSNVDDLFSHINENKIDHSVIIAHPPYIPNHFVIQLANNHKNIIPFVNIPYNKAGAAELFEHYIDLGAKGLKIHAASDGGEVMSDHYLSLLEIANKHSLPVIIHTGCIHIKPVYKEPEMGHAEKFQVWFQDFPNIKFVLAHMNYHFPETVIELMKEHANLYTDTSWQPKEVIANTVKEVGADRIMFGTDWPIIGNNISVCLERIIQARDEKLISEEDAEKILGLNAKSFFGL